MLQRQRAAERLDGHERLFLGHRGIAGHDQTLKLTLLAYGIPRENDADHEGRHIRRHHDEPFH